MTITIEQSQVPLRVDETGTIRVGGTRVILELVVDAFNRGKRPEAIVRAYDALKLSDVYSVIGYYLDHRAEIDAYIARRDEEAQRLREKIEANLMPPELLKKVLDYRDQRRR